MRTLFIGGTKRGWLSLQALLKHSVELVGIISLRQDDHEVERYESEIANLAVQHHIPCYETKWMKDQDYQTLIGTVLRPDIALVVGCRILISPAIYTLPKMGALAIHDSLLPQYRGFAPMNWSIINGEPHAGATLFYLSERMDAGDIVAQKTIPIHGRDTAPTVYDKICSATVDLIDEAFPLLMQGIAPRIPQEERQSSYTCSRTPSDGLIDWKRPASEIHDLIRGLTYPYPGAFTFYAGEKLVIRSAEPLSNSPRYVGRIPGRVVAISQQDGWVDVLTGEGVLRIREIGQEDGSWGRPSAVIRSVRAKLGIDLQEVLHRLAYLERKVAMLESGCTVN